jgi:hypothetical protein
MTRQAGFLTQRLGTIMVYCNRVKTSGMWYIRNAKGENVPIDAPSFQSTEGGMRGLQIYETTRGGKEGFKVGLILEGDDYQVYQFETSAHTAFARGMLWAIAHMNERDIEKGQIGLNPTPADPSRTDSDNAESILYCNMFVNGVEQPRLPSESQQVNWQEIAQRALSVANRCEYPIDQVPASGFFLNPKEARKQQQKTGQPRRSTGQNVRSGVTAPQQAARALQEAANVPIQPPNAPKGLQATANSTVEPAEVLMTEEELDEAYSQIMLSLDQAYLANDKEIDGDRMQKVLDRFAVVEFDDLNVNVKNQLVCTLAKELIESKYPQHSAVGRLLALSKKAANNEVFKGVTQTLLAAFSPNHVIQPDSEIPF